MVRFHARMDIFGLEARELERGHWLCGAGRIAKVIRDSDGDVLLTFSEVAPNSVASNLGDDECLSLRPDALVRIESTK